MKEQDAEINALFNKISELEIRVENQNQYSRRTNLRFHNKGNNKITELRTILQRESQNS